MEKAIDILEMPTSFTIDGFEMNTALLLHRMAIFVQKDTRIVNMSISFEDWMVRLYEQGRTRPQELKTFVHLLNITPMIN